MKRTYLFPIVFMMLWGISILLVLPEIAASHKRGANVVEVIIAITILSIAFIISAIGIGLKRAWARRLHIYTSILGILLIIIAVVYATVTQQVVDPIIFIFGIMVFLPWIGIFLFGIYYLNRKDVCKEFGLVNDEKSHTQ